MEILLNAFVLWCLKGILWFLAGILSIVLTILFKDPINWVLARLFGRAIPASNDTIRGLWLCRYSYDSDPDESDPNKTMPVNHEEVQLIEIRQLGKFIWGKNLSGNNHFYNIKATFHQARYVTGEWRNNTERDNYHGAFQFVVVPMGKKMNGQWVGFGKKGKVKSGPWDWILLNGKVKDNIIKEYLSKPLKWPEE
jgi:hypothetical protein